jgi:peptidoglycan biosynthesis protein MviN/MurJ (putative lipid II flippase)
MPAAVALIVLAEPIVNVLFQHGKFGVFETEMTAKAVVVYAISLPVYVMVKALTPNFFARCDTKTPVKYSAVVLIANLVFALLLMKFVYMMKHQKKFTSKKLRKSLSIAASKLRKVLLFLNMWAM